ncbi:MAG: aldo/keto reductase [Bacteroidetes bacterium]|nr:aldo/keto reductase [Bacteroidota bacterium]
MSIGLESRPFGSTGIGVGPLGMAATYWPGKKAVHTAFEEGINLFFAFGIDRQMTRALSGIMSTNRERVVLATGAYNYVWRPQDVRKTFEKRLRQFKTDYIDIFLFQGVMKPEQFTPRVYEDMLKLREEGKVRAIGISCHNRKFLGRLASDGSVNALMLRIAGQKRISSRSSACTIRASSVIPPRAGLIFFAVRGICRKMCGCRLRANVTGSSSLIRMSTLSSRRRGMDVSCART